MGVVRAVNTHFSLSLSLSLCVALSFCIVSGFFFLWQNADGDASVTMTIKKALSKRETNDRLASFFIPSSAPTSGFLCEKYETFIFLLFFLHQRFFIQNFQNHINHSIKLIKKFKKCIYLPSEMLEIWRGTGKLNQSFSNDFCSRKITAYAFARVTLSSLILLETYSYPSLRFYSRS